MPLGELKADERPSWAFVLGDADAPGIHADSRNAKLIRNMPWHETPLGPISEWDPFLISALNLVLGARFPMFVTWGAENHLFYNDAYEFAIAGKLNCLGRPFRSVFPEAWPEVGPILQKALDGQSTYLEDFHVFLVRNAVLADSWWSFSYSPVHRMDGEIGGVLGVVHETTRRLLAEQKLWSREAALRSVADTAPALLWRCEPDGRLTWANQRLKSFRGAMQLENAYWEEGVHPEDNLKGREYHTYCMANGSAFECQQRLRDVDGRYRWFLVRAQQVWDTEGRLSAWCGSAVDIDDWRRAADGLGEQTDLVSEFRDAETGLMWVADVSTRRLEGLNPRFRSSWALPTAGDGIIWEEWMRIVHPDDRPAMAGSFDRVAQKGETIQGRFRAEAPDGSVCWFHASAFPIPDEEGVIRRIGGLLVEITRKVDQRIYLVDADPTRQAGVVNALSRAGFRVRAFSSAQAYAKVAEDLLPGVMVLAAPDDIRPLTGLISALKPNISHLPWIAMGDFEHRLSDVVQLMKLGASNVLTNRNSLDALIEAARSAQPLVTVGSVASPKPQSDARQKLADLTRREREVLDGLLAGQTNKMIALSLSLSPRTIETYRAQLMDRLGVRTLAELLRLATEAGASESS